MGKTSVADGRCALDMAPNPDYYKYGYDNSMSCYITNYALTACILVCIYVLFRGYTVDDFKLKQEHTRFFIMMKFLFVGVSVLAAGFVHQGCFGRAADLTVPANQKLWLITEGALLIAGGFTFCAAHTLFEKKDNTPRNYKWYFCSFIAGGLVVFGILNHFDTNAFAISGFLGEFLPDFWLLIRLAVLRFPCGDCFLSMSPAYLDASDLRGSGEITSGWLWTLISVLVIYVGGTVQVLLGGTCGNPCPQSCIFPAVYFNHNAFFHVAQFLGMILMTKGMSCVCKAVEKECLREVRSNNKEPLLP